MRFIADDPCQLIGPLPELLQDATALGATCFRICPSFSPAVPYHLLYTDTEVTIYRMIADQRAHITFPLTQLRKTGPVARWQSLWEAARTAPSCANTSMLDGISYTHCISDRTTTLNVRWSNPGSLLHPAQYALLDSYHKLLVLAEAHFELLRLKPGRQVVLQQGLLTGFEGVVEQVDEERSLIKVRISFMGKETIVPVASDSVLLLPIRDPKTQ